VTNEGQNSRTQLQGLRPCLPVHESSWHRLDCILFRYHPCFRLPIETERQPDQVVYFPCENGLIITAPTGIILILIRVPGRSFPIAWFEYPSQPEKEVFLFESDIIERLPEEERNTEQKLLLEAISEGGGRVRIDWARIMKEGRTHIPQHPTEIFQSRMVGYGNTQNSTDLGYFIFNNKFMTTAIVNIRISLALSSEV
jgi:Putative peptidase family